MDFRLWSKIRTKWETLSLTQKFVSAMALVVILAASFVGSWVSNQISASVLLRNADTTALYMQSILGPAVHELETQDMLSPKQVQRLDEISADPALRKHVRSIKIWRRDGTVVYATNKDLVGQNFGVEEISAALAGKVTAYFDDLDQEENVHEREIGIPLYEVYIPLFAGDSRTVVAVGEFYEDGTLLKEELWAAFLRSWFTVGGTVVFILLALVLIVRRGDSKIRQQQQALEQSEIEYRTLVKRNADLKSDIDTAKAKLSDLEVETQRRIGMELHDGPAQLLTFILMHLDEIRDPATINPDPDSHERRLIADLRRAASGALGDIRALSRGLFLAYPDEGQDFPVDLANTIEAHEKLTKSTVDCQSAVGADVLPKPVAQTALQVIREGLMNAYKHAPENQRLVKVLVCDENLTVVIENRGPSPDRAQKRQAPEGGLGLAALSYRVGQVGGTLELVRPDGDHTRLTARFPISVAPA